MQAVHPAITDRNYTIDLYEGAALGSTKIVGMGGVGIAIAEGSAYMSSNPAAAAVRPATSNGTWDWDIHLDWLNPQLGDDFDNDGDPNEKVGSAVYLTAGLLGQWRGWGLGISASVLRHVVTLPDGSQADPQAVITHALLARTFWDDVITLGIGVKVASFTIGPVVGNQRTQTLFDLTGAGVEAGGVWRPKALPLRVGISMQSAVSGTNIAQQGCDPMNCQGFILPNEVDVPWKLAGGVAWRYGTTPWNQKIAAHWRAERELVVEADVVVDGPVTNGSGIEAFLQKQLQISGREASVSPRLGADFEWIPGWLRVRGGTYWEPGRFFDNKGRIHGTVGLDVGLFSFGFLGDPYRLCVSLASDAADRYANAALSIGFWH